MRHARQRTRPRLVRDGSISSSWHEEEWIVNLGSRDAYSRIGHLICEVFLKLKAVGLTKGNTFDFPITQGEIGDATGLSTVHVNRSIQDLRKDGLIILEKGRCTIADLSRLEEAAMFDPTYLHLTDERSGGNGPHNLKKSLSRDASSSSPPD